MSKKETNETPFGIDALQGPKRITPLMRVIEKCNYELVETLINAGANIRVMNENDEAAFHFAARLLCNNRSSCVNWPNQGTAPEIFQVKLFI